MTRYFQAADIYVHAARADTFPNSILEALACGTPVAATAVGGIPEQIQSARPCDGVSPATAEAAETDGPTGWLVPPHDPVALAAAITWLLDNPDLRRKLGRSAAVTARRRFDLQRQTRDYLSWYHDACSCGPAGSPVKNTVLPPATRDFRDLLSVLATHAGTQT